MAEVAIVGEPAAPDTRRLLEVVDGQFRPWVVLAVATDADASAVPLLHGRERRDGRATAFVCRGFTCRQPVTEPAALADELGRAA
jgi:uncharacterized protein YyaL (SSP411 family)